MHFKKLTGILILLISICNCNEEPKPIPQAQIIPAPQTIEVLEKSFTLTSNIQPAYDTNLEALVDYCVSFLKNGFKNKSKPSGDETIIQFVIENNLDEEEYKLRIDEKLIVINAGSEKGVFYAFQTLRQLLPPEFENGDYDDNKVVLPCVDIRDKPKFEYRGMHLDVGRHMYSVEFIKKYIDAMAMLKMNTFHWHLTEDQGWRIEIKKYPKLQEIAAYRDETLVGHYSDQPHQFDGKKYGGYYTQEEIKDIVAYAEERFVTIIPEIEMPGHSQAAIAAYPELGCTGEQVKVAKKWGVFEEVYCPSETTFKFLEDVIDEVVALFPSKYIHIGGDEAPKTRWKNCSDCQDLIKEKGLKDEHGLQSYFIARMEKYINSKGKQIIGWDEILEGGLAPNATVMSWRGTNGAIEAAKAGHDVILTPTSHCYFDYYQSENDDEPLAIGGFLPLEKVYSFNPIPEELSDEESQYVLGAQGNIWTEYMPTEDQVEYMAFPRMLAMSEVLWTNSETRNYDEFVKRVEAFYKRLDALDINYANHLYEIEGNVSTVNGKTFYNLKTFSEGKTIRYTTDGSEPNANSAIYNSPIPISEDVTIKASVFNEQQQLGKHFMQNIKYHKAVGAKISINKEPHKAYLGSGAEGLINGISGSDKRYGDKEWLGFWGEDIEIKIDLEKATEISSIKTRFHNGNGQWIYAPKHIRLKYILDDGSLFTDDHSLKISDERIVDFESKMMKVPGRKFLIKSITVMAPNYGTIPEGKQGAGNKAWTFIDEIIVN
ncbi:beta-N-acetylhexosaminidase [Winogradskyella tangerina]|uniref:beta-N-acetylhexosaminidase n=1 Tax=Winogradskyella tangerina TaxID=2023240 RepID=UPI000DBEA784|nr:family 20 glycosylhydrolase [Winogradskyella tangerina]